MVSSKQPKLGKWGGRGTRGRHGDIRRTQAVRCEKVTRPPPAVGCRSGLPVICVGAIVLKWRLWQPFKVWGAPAVQSLPQVLDAQDHGSIQTSMKFKRVRLKIKLKTS